MTFHRHLSRAPLREALIDIQFEPRVPLERIDKFVAGLGSRFVAKGDLWETFFGLTHEASSNAPPTTQSSQSVVGRRLELDDGLYVLQCRVQGFTLSRLTPYGEWSDLEGETKRLWSGFLGVVGRLTVTRIAVRYINELKLPMPILDFGTYLTCPPKIPEGLPQGVISFLSRVVIPDEANGSVSVVTQALEGPPNEGSGASTITVVLDIDVFRQTRLDSLRTEDVWSCLATLREQKNRMFFAHLTEKTVEMYT